ncbi:MAG: zupT [Oscillospiraceae bacterium]|nr:zupT [Oscillospiraceae bacterium]
MPGNAMMPLVLSVAAGGATVIGALLAVAVRRPKSSLLTLALGFSAGVMLAVSLLELLPQAAQVLLFEMPGLAGTAVVVFSCSAGMLCSQLLDSALPCRLEQIGAQREQRLMRLGLFSMLALMLHNLPEGMAVFLSASQNARMGLKLCAAIALHNIPEGISVAMPVYAALHRRTPALFLATISGAAEPLGALLALRFLQPVLTERGLAMMFCGIAGLMSAISVSELLPEALCSKQPGYGVAGVLFGILLMLINCCVF